MSAPEWADHLARRAGTGDAAEAERVVVDGMVEALEQGRMEPYDGAVVMVREVAERVPIALATSAAAPAASTPCSRATGSTRPVRGHRLERRGRRAASRAPTSTSRPPAGSVSRPAACVGVEDSSNGIRSAHAAGMTVVAIPNPTYPPKPDAHGARRPGRRRRPRRPPRDSSPSSTASRPGAAR